MKTLKTLLATTCMVASSIGLSAQTASWSYGSNAATLNPATANLGIGLTATTANKLSLKTSSSTQNGLRIYNSTGSTLLLSHYNGGLSIGSSATPPAGGLYVAGNISLDNDMVIGKGNKQFIFHTQQDRPNDPPVVFIAPKLSNGTGFDWGKQITLKNDGSLLMSAGYFGIGTTNPAGRIHVNTGSGGTGIYLGQTDNPGGSNSPMILWDSRKGGAEYFFMMRQTGNALTIERATGTPSMWDGNMRLLYIQAQSGNVGIGTDTPDYKLDVKGTIRAREVVVNLNEGADFVFEEDYALRPLNEVSDFIIANKHLPEIPSAANMVEKGLDMGEFQIKLLQKIEELTLYIIEQDKRIIEQDSRIVEQGKKIMELEKK